jgi:hypothetical protein
MQFIDSILYLFHRINYPFSLPSDIAKDLGITTCNRITLPEILQIIKNPDFKPSSLKKFMTKEAADAIFKHALRKDIFKQTSRFSYCFSKGVVEFVLFFDEDHRLRRAYIHNHDPQQDFNLEFQLDRALFYEAPKSCSLS